MKFFLVIALACISIIFWNSIVLFPVKLFVVLLHELSHGIAAVATGGGIVRMEINEMIGGSCQTTGGWPFVIVSSGYLGSTMLGGALLLLAQRPGVSRPAGLIIGILTVAVSVLFIRNLFGIFFGLSFGAALIVASKYLPASVVDVLVQYLGAMSLLYSLVDIKEDLLTLQHRISDTVILQQYTGIPALVWGISWSAVAVAIFIFVMYRAYRRAVIPR